MIFHWSKGNGISIIIIHDEAKKARKIAKWKVNVAREEENKINATK